MSITDWKHLERLVMALQAKLGAGAEVRHGEVVVGRQSKTERKVDVSVRGTLGTASVFVAIDCAHLDTNVDVMKVGIAKGQFEDIGAHRGIIVTTKGYSDGALELAAANGIDTCIMRPATPAEAAARQESVRMTVRLGTFSVESCILHLVDGSTVPVPPKSGLQLQNEAGEDGSLDENVFTALTTLPRSWSGEAVELRFDKPIFLASASGRVEVSAVRVKARHHVEEGEGMVVRQDGDWVFERMLPDRIESELVLFQFRELDRVAAADVLLREVCLTTACPIHGRAAKSLQVVWSLNEQKQRTAQFRIEPCCAQQDDAVFAALKQAVERLFEEEKNEALRFARAFLARARDSG